jgi:hypothetical protein
VCTPVIPALGRLRQEDAELSIVRPCLKKNQNNHQTDYRGLIFPIFLSLLLLFAFSYLLLRIYDLKKILPLKLVF